MKPHYFNQKEADRDDLRLRMCKDLGYVPTTCLLNGMVVWDEVQKGNDPCSGCSCERSICNGRPKSIKR